MVLMWWRVDTLSVRIRNQVDETSNALVTIRNIANYVVQFPLAREAVEVMNSYKMYGLVGCNCPGPV